MMILSVVASQLLFLLFAGFMFGVGFHLAGRLINKK